MDDNTRQDVREGISVTIVNCNGGEFLTSLVTSIINATIIKQVVVIDNASTDSSLEQLQRCCRNNIKLEIVSNQTNRGFAAANNQGAALSCCNTVLFINPDCEINPDDFERLYRLFNTWPDVGMAGVLICNSDGSEQRGCRRYLPDPRRSLMRVLGINRPGRSARVLGFDLVGTPLPPEAAEIEAISGAFMLVRRDAFLQVGGWDEGYFLHCEDLDLCMRFQRARWKILFVPDIVVVHHQGVSSRGRPFFILWHKHRGMWRYYNKFYRQDAMWLLSVAVWSGIWSRYLLLSAVTLIQQPIQWLRRHYSG